MLSFVKGHCKTVHGTVQYSKLETNPAMAFPDSYFANISDITTIIDQKRKKMIKITPNLL